LYFPTFPSCGLWMFNATIEYIALKAKTRSRTFSYNLFIKLLSWIWRTIRFSARFMSLKQHWWCNG
jgi:hypothetical protein